MRHIGIYGMAILIDALAVCAHVTLRMMCLLSCACAIHFVFWCLCVVVDTQFREMLFKLELPARWTRA